MTIDCRLNEPNAEAILQRNQELKNAGKKATYGLELSFSGIFVDKKGAVARVAKEMEEVDQTMEEVIQTNCEEEDFWMKVKKSGNGIVVEGNSRAR